MKTIVGDSKLAPRLLTLRSVYFESVLPEIVTATSPMTQLALDHFAVIH